MNSRFDKYLKELNKHQDFASIETTLNELHKSFASLTQSEQKYAKLFLHDLQRGDAQLVEGHTFRDYINTYKDNAENAQLDTVVSALGLDKVLLITLMADSVNDKNLNDFGRFDALKETVDKAKAKAYFEKQDGVTIPLFKLNIRIDQFLKQFIFAQTDDLLSDSDVVGEVMWSTCVPQRKSCHTYAECYFFRGIASWIR